MTYQDQQPVVVVGQAPPEIQGASTTALWIEIIFGLFGLLGIGHVYAGRVGLGVILMVGWWIFIAVAGAISTVTLGVAACLFVPLYIAGPIVSGIQARTFVLKNEKTGSFSSVAAVAGGGCLLVVLAGILIVFLSAALATGW